MVVADQDHGLVRRVRRAFGRQHVQSHRRTHRAADQRHRVVHAPADDVLHRAGRALRDAHDAVADLQLPRQARRPARHQFADGGVAVDLDQDRADAHQRQPHRDVEVFRGTRPQVVGVGLDRHRVRVHERLESVGAGDLAQAPGGAVVALVEDLHDRAVVLAGQLEPQPVVLDALAPEVERIGLGRGPGLVLAVDRHRFVALEIETLVQHAAGMGPPLGRAALVQVEDLEGHAQVLGEDRVVEQGAVDLQAIDVGLQEVELLGVERLQVLVEGLARQRVVERDGLVVVARQQFRRQVGRLGLADLRLEQQRGSRLRIGRSHLGCSRQCQDQPNQRLFQSHSITVERATPFRWPVCMVPCVAMSGGLGAGVTRRVECSQRRRMADDACG